MIEAHTRELQIGECVGSGHVAAPGAAGWLGLAATPTFGLMVVWTVVFSSPPDICMSAHDASPFNGMALMYTLMSIFHAAPWLRLISSRRIGSRQS